MRDDEMTNEVKSGLAEDGTFKSYCEKLESKRTANQERCKRNVYRC